MFRICLFALRFFDSPQPGGVSCFEQKALCTKADTSGFPTGSKLPHALPKVWSLFQDGAAVIQCVPGVELVGGSKGRIGMLCPFQETDTATEIHINTEVTLVGAAAHFADAELIRERFNGLVGEFAQSLEDKLDAAALLDVLGRSGDAGESPCAPIAFSRIREFFFPSTSKRLKDPVAPLADLNVSRKAPTRDLSSSASWRR